MEYEILKGLEPASFFYWFGELCKIPRGSRNEEHIIAFLRNYAVQRELECEVDRKGNVFMRIPATVGYEDQPSVLLQAHVDMVWATEPNVEFDFKTEPLRLCITGDKLHAQGTTLGADNGVGVATMLALGDGDDIAHPELEFLFTVEEEIGLVGVRQFDMRKIRSRRMINMDCGDSHVLCVSSAGRISGCIEKKYPFTALPQGYTLLKIALSDGLGGHSGLMINQGRACAGNNMGELLLALENLPMRLCSLHTAQKAILNSCTAMIALPDKDTEVAKEYLKQRFSEICSIYSQTDSNLTMNISIDDSAATCLEEKHTRHIATLLAMLHTGATRLNGNDPSIVITSSAIGNAVLEDGSLTVNFGVRSSSDFDQERLFDKYVRIADMLGMHVEMLDKYSGWPESAQSSFREKFNTAHKKLYGKEIALERVHGGIEVGMIMGAIPDMDAVGIAPTARGAHTPQEYLFISQVEPYWLLMKEVLAQKE